MYYPMPFILPKKQSADNSIILITIHLLQVPEWAAGSSHFELNRKVRPGMSLNLSQ